jgi:RNA-binding protein
MAVLTSKQKQFLKGLAHPLAPTVRVGKGGVTEGVIRETRGALAAHELIKVRIDIDEPAARKAAAEALAQATDAQVAGTVGKMAIVYRERDEEPSIRLPR